MNTEHNSLIDSYSPDIDIDEFREMVAKMLITELKKGVLKMAMSWMTGLKPSRK